MKKMMLSVLASAVLVLGVVFLQSEEGRGDLPGPSSEQPRARMLTDFRFGRVIVSDARSTPQAQQRFRNFLRGGVERMHVAEPATRPLTDQAALQKLEEARTLLRGQGALRGAWRWTDVQRVAIEIGTHYPLYEPQPEQADSDVRTMSYIPARRAFRLWPRNIVRMNAVDLAAILAHEATHAVYDELFAAQSGFTASEQVWLQVYCDDFRRVMIVTNEGLAHHNEAQWRMQRGSGLDVPGAPFLEQLMHAAYGSSSGDPAGTRAFAALLVAYAHDTERGMPNVQRGMSQPRCLPLVASRGAREGEWFSPVDVNPDFGLPLLRYVFGP